MKLDSQQFIHDIADDFNIPLTNENGKEITINFGKLMKSEIKTDKQYDAVNRALAKQNLPILTNRTGQTVSSVIFS